MHSEQGHMKNPGGLPEARLKRVNPRNVRRTRAPISRLQRQDYGLLWNVDDAEVGGDVILGGGVDGVHRTCSWDSTG